jgi:hypothetical protein
LKIVGKMENKEEKNNNILLSGLNIKKEDLEDDRRFIKVLNSFLKNRIIQSYFNTDPEFSKLVELYLKIQNFKISPKDDESLMDAIKKLKTKKGE